MIGWHTMRFKGWVRLWIVLSLIGVPALALSDFHQKEAFWNGINQSTAHTCVDQEFNLESHPDALECGRKQGSFKTVFEREGTTPGKYWPEVLFWSFVADVICTMILVGTVLVVRWVWRGFKS